MAGKFQRDQCRPLGVRRWLAPGAVALIGSGALCSSAVAQSGQATASGGPTIVISGDSVVASSLPSFGQTTIKATRPDALTGSPVVIGIVSGSANPFTPFSANTTTPTPFNPSGDCWQKGALSQALTPDLLPGDTVTITQGGFLGSGASSISSAVQPSDESGAFTGPVAGCSSIAPWAQNAITSAPSSVANGADLAVSGVAQPLATGVSLSAGDGSTTTAPVAVTPAADGSWSATIPATALQGLANKKLSVTPVVTVPDVSTGAPAHIAGVGASVDLTAAPSPSDSSPPPSSGSSSPAPTTNASKPPSSKPTQAKKPTPKPHVTGLRVASHVSLAKASTHGVTASVIVPKNAGVLRIRLWKGNSLLYTTQLRSQRPGTRQSFTLPAKLAKRLRAGTYMLAIKAGTTRTTLGPATTHDIHVTQR